VDHSRLEPVIDAARTLKRYEAGLNQKTLIGIGYGSPVHWSSSR